MIYSKLIFELSQPGRTGYKLPELGIEEKDDLIPEEFLSNEELDLPEVSEVDVARHYTDLSILNFDVDTDMYPLGSCTMKYDLKINEEIVTNPELARLHPEQDDYQVQGALEAMYTLQRSLCEVSGMDYMTLQPAAGTHGEITVITIFKKYHEANGNSEKNEIIVPDSAHGTNPATAAMTGYKVVGVKSNANGVTDVEDLRKVVNEKTVSLMLTNPNTLGLFETKVKEIARVVHGTGGLLYYDGANVNAILGHARPGDMGFDTIHFNVHKTSSTPHDSGSPGTGPMGVKKFLRRYLPKPIIEKDGDKYFLDYSMEHSIGRIEDFQGHFGILMGALTYTLTMGSDGLRCASITAVLSASYLQAQLKDDYNLSHDFVYKYEFVLDGLKDDCDGQIKTLDVAERLLDMGFHPPIVCFPLIIHEALMVEPTEIEPRQTLDAFVATTEQATQEARENKDILLEAPITTVVRRPDETEATKNLILTFKKGK